MKEFIKKIFRKFSKPSQTSLCINKDQVNLFEPIDNPFVSVVLPVYNQADLIGESIDSIINQTYTNWELIIINDGSTDNINEVLSKYKNHSKIKIYTQTNQRLPLTLNNGFALACGDFYTWTSADNISLPTQLEVLVEFLKNNLDCGMVYSDYLAIDDRGENLNDKTFRPHNQDINAPHIIKLPDEVTLENFHLSGDNFIGASFMYRKGVAQVVGQYLNQTFGGEDYDYWLRINSLFKIGHCSNLLYKYRVHDNTLNAKAKELKLYDNIRRLLELDRLRLEFINNKKIKIQEVRKSFGLDIIISEQDSPESTVRLLIISSISSDFTEFNKYDYIFGADDLLTKVHQPIINHQLFYKYPNKSRMYKYMLFTKKNKLSEEIKIPQKMFNGD